MIYFYWPKKDIPEWLQTISFSGKSKGVPKAHHNGFGLVFKKNDQYHVRIISGSFIYVNGAGMTVDIKGGGDGVFINV